MKKAMIDVVSVVICCLIFSSVMAGEKPAWARDAPSKYTPYFPNYPPLTAQEMMEFVRAGAEYLEKDGDVAEMNKKRGRFTMGVVRDYRYLTVADCKTLTIVAHPFFPDLIGKMGFLKILKDATGRLYGVEGCIRLKRNPKGIWLVVLMKSPGGTKLEPLYGYALYVESRDMFVNAWTRNLRLQSELRKNAEADEKSLQSLLK